MKKKGNEKKRKNIYRKKEKGKRENEKEKKYIKTPSRSAIIRIAHSQRLFHQVVATPSTASPADARSLSEVSPFLPSARSERHFRYISNNFSQYDSVKFFYLFLPF